MMNQTILKVALTSIAMLSLVACQPRNDEASVNVSGNISASEQSVTSESALNGQPMNLMVTNIGNNSFINGGGWGFQVPNIDMTVMINNVGMNIFMTPTMLDNSGSFAENLQLRQIGNFQIRHQAICEGLNCESVFINMILIPNFGAVEVKQIGIYFSRINRRVLSALEFQGNQVQVMSGVTLINNLRSLSGQ